MWYSARDWYARGTIESHRLLAHELTHVIQQSAGGAAMVQRQLEIPVFDEFDPCVIVEGRKLCGSDAKTACEKIPGLPGCGTVCKIFGCKKPEKPSAKCPPGFRAGGSTDFKGQCCKEGTVAENERDCCRPERIGFKDSRCCGEGEVASDGKCVKSSDLPPLPPSTFCLPSQKTISGKCCALPLIPGRGSMRLAETAPTTVPSACAHDQRDRNLFQTRSPAVRRDESRFSKHDCHRRGS